MVKSLSRHPLLRTTFVSSSLQRMQESFWFLPTAIVLSAVLLASLLIYFDSSYELPTSGNWSLIFGASASGARGLLSAVAGSMITVAGVVFSITIVALSLTSSQYTSRVIRNFMGDRLNQSVLGVFLGIFAYCLVVLRVIRGSDEGAFVPSLAVLVALLLAFVGIGYLIFFIHYIAVAIQASSIIAAASEETIDAVDTLFPDPLGDDGFLRTSDEESTTEIATKWSTIRSQKTGYIVQIEDSSLLAFAEEHDVVIRMVQGIGEFAVEASPLLLIGEPHEVSEKDIKRLHAMYVIGRHRTVAQDVGFGIRQIVDVALKALSPGINDTTTAVMCVDYLKAILVRLANRETPSPLRMSNHRLRVIARGPDFESLTGVAFDQIRQIASGNTAVLLRILAALELIVRETDCLHREKLILLHASLVVEVAKKSIVQQYDRDQVSEAMFRFSHALAKDDVTLLASNQ